MCGTLLKIPARFPLGATSSTPHTNVGEWTHIRQDDQKNCKCVTCDEIIDCMEKRGDFYGSQYRWSLLNFDCRTFVLAATGGCCLNVDHYWTW